MTTERIGSILQSVSQRVEDLFPSDRFYTVLYDCDRNELSFPLVRQNNTIVANAESGWANRLAQANDWLLDQVIRTGKHLLIEHGLAAHLNQQKLSYWPDDPIPYSWLGVPFTIGGKVAGALIFENWHESNSFDSGKLPVLITIARQTATALENAQIREQLEWKIKHLQTLNHAGQQLTKGLIKQEQEILALIQQSVTHLNLDSRTLCIVFHEPGSSDDAGNNSGQLRFALAFENGERIQIADRPAATGLISHVIHTGASFNPPNVEQACAKWGEKQNDRIPLSWLGVPMISSDGQVFGIIILRHNEVEGAFSQDDQEILEILANQAAVSLQVQRQQHTQIEMERIFATATVAAEFAHKMNNIAGTIPVRIDLVRQELMLEEPDTDEIHAQLGKIETEVKNLLTGAQEIRKTIKLGETGTLEDVSIPALIETAVARARNTRLNLEADVKTSITCGQALPVFRTDRNALLDTLTNIIKNAFEAIPEQGMVSVQADVAEMSGRTWIEIKIADTGKGIPASELTKIFDLFFTTKGERGLGFGLWRDKVFIKKLGGEIDVQSKENHGSTFTFRLPVNASIRTADEK
jgi:signal transduction histidine kinase